MIPRFVLTTWLTAGLTACLFAFPVAAQAGEPAVGKVCSFQGQPAKILELSNTEAYNTTTGTTRQVPVVSVVIQGGPQANQRLMVTRQNLDCP